MVGLTFCIIYIAAALRWAPLTLDPKWTGVTPSSFQVVFTQATRIQIASMFAFLIGNLVDIGVFFFLKKLTGNRMSTQQRVPNPEISLWLFYEARL